eukprot:12495415-Alexandrium_andersonii.AAC.1
MCIRDSPLPRPLRGPVLGRTAAARRLLRVPHFHSSDFGRCYYRPAQCNSVRACVHACVRV